MPRRKAAPKKEILPDPLYNSIDVSKFINVVMRKGKKSIAARIVYDSIANIAQRAKKDKKPHHADSADAASSKKGSSKKPVSSERRGPVTAEDEGLEILTKALNNIRPTVEVKSRRVGGATYQVPIEVDTDRGLALARRWLVEIASARGEKTMTLRLAAEIMDASEGRGGAVKKREDMTRMAKANQAFAHYRW